MLHYGSGLQTRTNFRSYGFAIRMEYNAQRLQRIFLSIWNQIGKDSKYQTKKRLPRNQQPFLI